VGTDDSREIVFTSGATQSINLVAQSYGRKFLSEGDEVIISHLEHHANIVPWQVICEDTGASLKVIPVDDNGDLLMDEYAKLLNGNTKIVAVTHVSNALGTINPVKKIVAMAHDVGAVVLIDGAQSAPHMRVNVKDIDCDFFVFSGHKMYGPSGVGVLYGKFDILKTMPPYVTGGEMIETVTFEKTTFVEPPLRFEAGTPPITQVIGLGAAVDFIRDCGFEKISLYENDLLEYGTSLLQGIDGLKIIGNAKEKSGIISFTLDTVHPHDVVTILGEEGIAVRGGHHCAQPAMRRFNVPATARASVSFYNTREELDALAEGVRKAMEMFS
ncbi:Cysteine desulfurase =_ SufS, partial [hydrothermal vent metagenome]